MAAGGVGYRFKSGIESCASPPSSHPGFLYPQKGGTYIGIESTPCGEIQTEKTIFERV